jgi:BolA family transcriptional regulator, general stress-responsive regulator
MGLDKEIAAALESAFAPDQMILRNDSHRHAGHAGDDGTGESHWHLTLRAAALAPLSRVDRHRAVHRALGPAIMGRIHALALDLG